MTHSECYTGTSINTGLMSMQKVAPKSSSPSLLLLLSSPPEHEDPESDERDLLRWLRVILGEAQNVETGISELWPQLPIGVLPLSTLIVGELIISFYI